MESQSSKRDVGIRRVDLKTFHEEGEENRRQEEVSEVRSQFVGVSDPRLDHVREATDSGLEESNRVGELAVGEVHET